MRSPLPTQLYVLFFIFFISCKENRYVKSEKPNQQRIELFRPLNADLKYQSATAAEQWRILITTTKNQYKNKSIVTDWLHQKVIKKLKNPNGLTPELLKELNYELFYSDYDEPALKLAYFSLNSTWGKENLQDHAIPAVTLSDFFKKQQQIDSLIKYNQILAKYIDTDTLKIVPITYYANQGAIETKKGNFFQAVLNYYKALDVTPKTDSDNLSILYHDLAVTYLNLEYFNKSLQYMDLSLKHKNINKFPLNGLNTIGVIYSKSNAFVQADSIFKKVIDEARTQEQLVVLAQSYANYGNLNRKMKRFDLAIDYMQKSDSICKDIGLDFGILINYINRAEVFHDQGLHQKAAAELEKGRQNFDKINDIKINKELYHLYYRIQDALGNSTTANTYYRLYNENKNQIFGDLSKTVIAEWELQNEKNTSLKKEAAFEINLQKKNKNIVLVWLLLAVTLLSGLVIYFILFQQKEKEKEKLKLEKQKLAFELEMTSKELLIGALNNSSISSFKEKIYSQLQDLLTDLPKTHQPKIKAFAKKIKQSNEVHTLEEFNTRFRGVYEGFYEKLNEIAADLTPTEMNVCALIRLNLTSKEIATLTNRTVGTVENIRINIRKKLRLKSPLNLKQELLKIY